MYGHGTGLAEHEFAHQSLHADQTHSGLGGADAATAGKDSTGLDEEGGILLDDTPVSVTDTDASIDSVELAPVDEIEGFFGAQEGLQENA